MDDSCITYKKQPDHRFCWVNTGLDGRLLFLLAVLMEFVSSLISFLVGYYAMKGYRASSARGLFLLYFGFIVLGIGTFLRATTATYFAMVLQFTELPQPALVALLNFAGLIYTLTQLAAYSLFVATYVVQARTMSEQTVAISAVSAAVFPIYKLFFIPSLELIAIVMLGFVTVHSFNNWLLKKNSESALVTLGFGFMLFSHLLFLFMEVEETLLFFGQITQLAGFICLLTMLARVSKANG